MENYSYFSWLDIQTWMIYKYDYCLLTIEEAVLNNTEWNHTCIQRQTIYSINETYIKETWISILWTTAVFILILMVLWRILRVLFGKFFGGRWKLY